MRAELIPLDGGQAIPLVNEISVVGRKQGLCEVVLQRPNVSKLHCVLVKTDGLLFVRDLGSTNGTKVNGQRITRGALLPGDELAFSNVKFRVHLTRDAPQRQDVDDKTEPMAPDPPEGQEKSVVAPVDDSGSDSDVRLLE